MVTESTGELDEVVDSTPGEPHVEILVRTTGQSLGEQLTLVPGRDQLSIAFETDDRPELGEDPVGKTVIRRDFDLTSQPGRLAKVVSKSVGEFLSRLVSEGDPQRGFRVDLLSLDQGGQAHRHGRRLSSPGSG
jgi:hypothetical protein